MRLRLQGATPFTSGHTARTSVKYRLPLDDLRAADDVIVPPLHNLRESALESRVDAEWLLNLSRTYCDVTETAAWMQVCATLRVAWAANASARHHAHVNDPKRSERWHADKTHCMNAGDAVLPVATRLAFQFFLGRPRWQLRNVWGPFSNDTFAEVNDASTLAVVVGGGGLINPNSNPMRSELSGWHWRMTPEQMQNLKPPIFVFAIGFNGFRGDSRFQGGRSGSLAPKALRHALNMSMRAITGRADSMLGLRESSSLDASASRTNVFGLVMPTSRRGPLVYQPCATALVGAIQPALSTRRLLDERPDAKHLSINLAGDRETDRVGGVQHRGAVFKELALFCRYALDSGWKVTLVSHVSYADSAMHRQLLLAAGGDLDKRVKHKNLESNTVAEIYQFYRGVTVAASMRGHGVMIPFGIHCATISLISHDKVKAFVDDIGHPEWGVELLTKDRPSKSAAGLSDELRTILDRIDANRNATYHEIKAAQAALLARTARNMLHYGQQLLPRAHSFLEQLGPAG